MPGHCPLRQSSADSAARFIALREERHEQARDLAARVDDREWTLADTRAFREVVRAAIGRSPKGPTAIRVEVERTWGAFTFRRLERALVWLRGEGAIVRTAGGYVRETGRRGD